MRTEPSIMHLDLDAFFASVEQRDKPSLRGKPVVVGGVGGRGVVATASYEARAFGVRSAMPTAQARRLCPHAAFLTGRFAAYSQTSQRVMDLLREFTPLVEPLSLDEAYLDLTAGPARSLEVDAINALGQELKREVRRVTGGVQASIGAGSSKLIAKIASDLDKPDGLVVVAPGMEQDLIRPMPIRVIPGIGPATEQRLRLEGVVTVADAEALTQSELTQLLGQSHGSNLFRIVRARDDRPVLAVREAKSISVEDTYETDHVDPVLLDSLLDRQAEQVAGRLARAQLSGRTISIKVRLADFSTSTRSLTLPEPVDSTRAISGVARQLIREVDTTSGVRLLGVGISGLTDWVQEPLFDLGPEELDAEHRGPSSGVIPAQSTAWPPGKDVQHDEYGAGWVWGSGHGVVTIRFETATTGPGPVRTFSVDDPALKLVAPQPPWSRSDQSGDPA
ncbi:MAG TPA: DNA polymerase IV [Marmoricola sp.]|nr:DNA polymerase IV [Marmoricola sp.]